MQSVHLQLPADLLARVDEAAGDVPRNRWIRRAIERALGTLSEPGDSVTLDGWRNAPYEPPRPKGGKR